MSNNRLTNGGESMTLRKTSPAAPRTLRTGTLLLQVAKGSTLERSAHRAAAPLGRAPRVEVVCEARWYRPWPRAGTRRAGFCGRAGASERLPRKRRVNVLDAPRRFGFRHVTCS